uniref:hypothetical protein n=1 Tax=Burkholderia arboris TaxID=488730 RepID=UPI003BEEF099
MVLHHAVSLKFKTIATHQPKYASRFKNFKNGDFLLLEILCFAKTRRFISRLDILISKHIEHCRTVLCTNTADVAKHGFLYRIQPIVESRSPHRGQQQLRSDPLGLLYIALGLIHPVYQVDAQHVV